MVNKENNFSIQKSTEGVPLALVFEGKNIPFRHVTENEIFELRASGNPGFVYKSKNNLYYSEIDLSYRFVTNSVDNYVHQCNNCHFVGNGCKKITDLSKQRYEKIGENSIQSLISSKRIEKYSFIEEGFEAFNIELETLYVIKCTKNSPCDRSTSNKLSVLLKQELIENLEDFYMNSLS